ncbi:MAG: hypothetical protein WC406_08260 [Methanoregula sp.]|jgi:hypothetical protein
MSPDKMEDFDVVFDVKMPGALKKTPYTIKVTAADSPGEALAIAEAQYQKITGQYDVRVVRVPAKPVAGTPAESHKEG